MNSNGLQEITLDDADDALRSITRLLRQDKDEKTSETLLAANGVPDLLAYLDNRVCVPRDMGAPSEAAIRQLNRKVLNHNL
jgi:hypothetical protein